MFVQQISNNCAKREKKTGHRGGWLVEQVLVSKGCCVFQAQTSFAPNHLKFFLMEMGVSKNRGTPKSSILIELSIINHPFWGPTPIFGNTQMVDFDFTLQV